MTLELALAARWWGYSRVEHFRNLPRHEQVELLAVYRSASKIEALANHLAAKQLSSEG